MTSSQDRFIIPALLPPPGVTPNFVITGNPIETTVVLVAVFLPTATFFVWTRMYTKIRLIKSHGWEDCELFDFQGRDIWY